jgi:hypothetical protein
MRLHCDVRIQVVERAVGLLAAVPAALVHALDLFVASARALVLLGTGDGDERVDLKGEDGSANSVHFTISHTRARALPPERDFPLEALPTRR